MTRYRYDAQCRDFALSANFVLKDVLMSGRCKNKKGSESIVHKEKCFVEE